MLTISTCESSQTGLVPRNMLTGPAFYGEGNKPLSRLNMDHRNFSKIHVSVLCLVAALAGCSSSDADQVSLQSRIISSCSNSARMALNGWHLNQLPDAYVRQTLHSMQRNVETAASEIEALRDVDTTERELLTSSVTDIVNLLAQAQNQVARGDHDTVQTAVHLKDATERLSLTSGIRRST
ncbi:hypothetical protein LPU83_pLPU83c_0077 (plasmid) [Rhizobium favelukesii]|uniref:Uncharacterized protein n=2 Tax=Rhizobium/Agrobacterium group TaxID=227290 RepID=W6RIF5_9HYPH|nr:hypothetical protein LPU83_pLPU83c_0077 [Rhizobium favelukesii]